MLFGVIISCWTIIPLYNKVSLYKKKVKNVKMQNTTCRNHMSWSEQYMGWWKHEIFFSLQAYFVHRLLWDFNAEYGYRNFKSGGSLHDNSHAEYHTFPSLTYVCVWCKENQMRQTCWMPYYRERISMWDNSNATEAYYAIPLNLPTDCTSNVPYSLSNF